MTPDELDAVLSDRPDLNPFEEALIAALREAWADNERTLEYVRNADQRVIEADQRTDAAEREVKRLRVDHDEHVGRMLREWAEDQAAVARVRARHRETTRYGATETVLSCSACGGYDYPCATIRDLDGAS